MVPGTVSVANDGTITYTPNNATNCAKAKFVAEKTLIDAAWAAQSNPTPVAALQALALVATVEASWLVPYLQGTATAKIAGDASGDGLQAGTTHPASDKFLPIV